MVNSYLDSGIWINHIEDSAGLAQLFNAAFKWFDHPQFTPETPVLWDARDAFLQISYEELTTSYLAQIDVVNDRRPVGRTAWLVSTSLNRVILDEIIDKVKWAADWQTFQGSNADAAIAWLRGEHAEVTRTMPQADE